MVHAKTKTNKNLSTDQAQLVTHRSGWDVTKGYIKQDRTKYDCTISVMRVLGLIPG